MATKKAEPGRQVALLRAVNVGGSGKVSMAALREALEGLGCSQVKTLLQSGNVTFTCARGSGALLEALLEAGCAKRLGLKTDFFVRSAGEWDALVADNPFPAEARDDPGHLHAIALKAAPDAAAVKSLQASIAGREQVRAVGRVLYATYPDGSGNSKLTLQRIERALGTRGTARNWNTVLKLAAQARAP
jgi:uncharacterized protein (DUF1697 family)